MLPTAYEAAKHNWKVHGEQSVADFFDLPCKKWQYDAQAQKHGRKNQIFNCDVIKIYFHFFTYVLYKKFDSDANLGFTDRAFCL